MAATLKIENFTPVSIKEKTYLDADVDAGNDDVPVRSSQNITANLFALVGTPGQEGAEMRRIASAASDVVALTSNLLKDHKKYDALTVLYGDKINIYRAPNVNDSTPADADFSLLNSVDIDYDQAETAYVDGVGGSGYWYKFTFYNSITTAESSLADSIASRGGSGSSYATLDDIRKEAGFANNRYITDTAIAEHRARAQSWIDSKLKSTFTVPFTSPVPPKITEITILYAAGRLLLKEYGDTSTGTNKDGKAKIEEAKELLEELRTGKSDLVDEGGNSLTTKESVSGWPNRETKDTAVEDGGSTRSFRIGQVF